MTSTGVSLEVLQLQNCIVIDRSWLEPQQAFCYSGHPDPDAFANEIRLQPDDTIEQAYQRILSGAGGHKERFFRLLEFSLIYDVLAYDVNYLHQKKPIFPSLFREYFVGFDAGESVYKNALDESVALRAAIPALFHGVKGFEDDWADKELSMAKNLALPSYIRDSKPSNDPVRAFFYLAIQTQLGLPLALSEAKSSVIKQLDYKILKSNDEQIKHAVRVFRMKGDQHVSMMDKPMNFPGLEMILEVMFKESKDFETAFRKVRNSEPVGAYRSLLEDMGKLSHPYIPQDLEEKWEKVLQDAQRASRSLWKNGKRRGRIGFQLTRLGVFGDLLAPLLGVLGITDFSRWIPDPPIGRRNSHLVFMEHFQ